MGVPLATAEPKTQTAAVQEFLSPEQAPAIESLPGAKVIVA